MTDAEFVSRILAESIRASFPAEIECPNCGIRGDDVIDLWSTWALDGGPQIPKRSCICGLCGHEWNVETEEVEG